MNSLLELFCDVDDFCQSFLPIWDQHLLSCGEKKRRRSRSLTISEIMTILNRNPQTNPLQILQGNRSVCDFRFGNQLFADAVWFCLLGADRIKPVLYRG